MAQVPRTPASPQESSSPPVMSPAAAISTSGATTKRSSPSESPVGDEHLAGSADNSIFSLKWNEFHKQLALGFSNLYQTLELADVTLCCDGKSAQAHKLVLAMCSPYFRQIFKDHPCQHPVVIIKGIKSHQLQLVLRFIYFGQVSVEKREIQNFIEAAELLKIDGISANDHLPEFWGQNDPSRVPSNYQRQTETLSSSKMGEAFIRRSGPSYPGATITRTSPHDRWSGGGGTPEMLSPASTKGPASDFGISPHSQPPPSHGGVLSGRRYSSRSSDGSGVYSDTGGQVTSVIRNPHISPWGSSFASMSRKESLSSPKSLRGSPTSSSAIPISPTESRRSEPGGSSSIHHSSSRADSPPFLEPPLPVVVSLEERPDEYLSEPGGGSMEGHSEGEYELSIRPIPPHPMSSYSRSFKTSAGIVSASVLKSMSGRRFSGTSPSPSSDAPDHHLTQEIIHASTVVVPAKKRFSHFAQGFRWNADHQEHQPLVLRPIYNPMAIPPPNPSSNSANNSNSSGPMVVPNAGGYLLTGGGSISAGGGGPLSPKVRAHRQSQVPQSVRYTSAQVDAIVDSVNDHSGPCVPCKICDKWVKRERLRAHIHECHLVHGEKIICPHCGVALKSKGSYRVHVWRHRRGVLARGLKSKRVLGTGVITGGGGGGGTGAAGGVASSSSAGVTAQQRPRIVSSTITTTCTTATHVPPTSSSSSHS